MVIRLSVKRWIDLLAFEAGVNVPLYWILADVRILTPGGWSPIEDGVIDTGNPVAVIARNVWTGASVEFLTQASRSIHGLGSTESTALRGRLGRVFLRLEDQESTSPPVEMTAYLLDDDRAPLLLGCEGILTHAILRTDLSASEASLEF